jgi:phage terminase large subunit-like protein
MRTRQPTHTSRQAANRFYADAQRDAEQAGGDVIYEWIREMCLLDLWFLLTWAMNRSDMNNRPEINPDWLWARTMEVQCNPNDKIDLWAREHYKSTIITFGLTVHDILEDPERTFGLFSVAQPLAQDFLKQIKQEFETNLELKMAFPDILYMDPERESPCWGIDKGIRVKRRANSREETVEAHGIFSLPTGKHFTDLVFDDIVTEKSVTNHEQLTKAFDQMRLAFSLGSHGGRRRMIGTRYHHGDAWGRAITDRIATPRLYAATEDGRPNGRGVFLTEQILEKKRRDQGPYIFACQMLLDPKADEVQGFKLEWLNPWTPKPEFWLRMNRYIVVDPAGERKMKQTGSDYTVFWVIGLAADERYYLIDGIRDRLNLTERADTLFSLVRTYKPLGVGYEQQGMQADIAHIEYCQERDNFHFDVTPLGGNQPKNDRIRKLIPLFSAGRFFTPGYLTKCDHAGAFRDIMKEFKNEEFLPFPVSTHDDMLDNLANILHPDLETKFPDPDEHLLLVGGYPNAGPQDISRGVIDYDPLGGVRG